MRIRREPYLDTVPYAATQETHRECTAEVIENDPGAGVSSVIESHGLCGGLGGRGWVSARTEEYGLTRSEARRVLGNVRDVVLRRRLRVGCWLFGCLGRNSFENNLSPR